MSCSTFRNKGPISCKGKFEKRECNKTAVLLRSDSVRCSRTAKEDAGDDVADAISAMTLEIIPESCQ
jgi:hypothetical protein